MAQASVLGPNEAHTLAKVRSKSIQKRIPTWILGFASLLLSATAAPRTAHAGAWTQNAGSGELIGSYLHLSATKLYGPDYRLVDLPARYEQHVWATYVEIGAITRWLTVTLESTLYRYNDFTDLGHTSGPGDAKIGLWTSLVVRPFHLSVGLLLGQPYGNPAPAAGPDVNDRAHARLLPTGDGETDLEIRVALGKSFGGWRRWPLKHYAVAEFGYWARTAGFGQSFTYRMELGINLPWKIIERVWFLVRVLGTESLTDNANVLPTPTGIGNGVAFTTIGGEVSIKLALGAGIAVGLDAPVRGRAIAAAPQVKLSLFQLW